MRDYYEPVAVWAWHSPRDRHRHAAIRIQLVQVTCELSAGSQRGELVYRVSPTLARLSAHWPLWWGYATRVSRAWNCLRLACELCGLREDTPPAIVADRVGELGEHRLEAELRWLWTWPMRWASSTLVQGEIPPLPGSSRTRPVWSPGD